MGTSTTAAVRRFAIRIGVGVVVIAMFCAGATQFVTASPRSVASDVAPVAAISESPTTVGVADSWLYYASAADIDTTLDAMQALGVQNVRIPIPWAGVQASGPNSYDWTVIDEMANAAAARNMGVLGVINSTPSWAGTPYLSGKPDPQALATFASAVAGRYAGKISAYEIWNEPNSSGFLNPVDPAGYTQLLKAAYVAIKAADPAATVIGGVVGSVASSGNATMSPEAFVAGMYAAGAKGSFDALSFHPYHYFLPFSAGGPVAESPLNQLDAIRQLMVTNGDAALKIWATEYGEPTSVVTELQQAAYLADFLTTWQTEAGAGPIFLYTTRDSAAGSTNPDDNLGLYYNDWTPKLAADVLKNFIAGDPQPPGVPPATAVGTDTALTTVLSFFTGIPVQIVAFVVGVVRNVVNFVTGVIQGINTFVQGVATTIANVLAPPAPSAAAAVALPVDSPVRVAAATTTTADTAVAPPLSAQSDAAVVPAKSGSAAGEVSTAAPSTSSEPTPAADSPDPAPTPDPPPPVKPTEPTPTPDPPSPVKPTEPVPTPPVSNDDEPSKTATQPTPTGELKTTPDLPKTADAATGAAKPPTKSTDTAAVDASAPSETTG